MTASAACFYFSLFLTITARTLMNFTNNDTFPYLLPDLANDLEDSFGPGALAPYQPIVDSLAHSGHPKWGFLVYRIIYDDDEA